LRHSRNIVSKHDDTQFHKQLGCAPQNCRTVTPVLSSETTTTPSPRLSTRQNAQRLKPALLNLSASAVASQTPPPPISAFQPLPAPAVAAMDSKDIHSGLDNDVKNVILKHLFARTEPIFPCLSAVRLLNGINEPDSLNAEIVNCPNVVLSLLRVNKALNESGSKYFYTTNKFAFKDAILLRNWIRTIGDKNLGRIKKIRFKMCGGCPQGFPVSQRQLIHICEENVWLKYFFYLRNRLKLDELKIVFEWEHVSTEQGMDKRRGRRSRSGGTRSWPS